MGSDICDKRLGLWAVASVQMHDQISQVGNQI
jgi:hypothetical protein